MLTVLPAFSVLSGDIRIRQGALVVSHAQQEPQQTWLELTAVNSASVSLF